MWHFRETETLLCVCNDILFDFWIFLHVSGLVLRPAVDQHMNARESWSGSTWKSCEPVLWSACAVWFSPQHLQSLAQCLIIITESWHTSAQILCCSHQCCFISLMNYYSYKTVFNIAFSLFIVILVKVLVFLFINKLLWFLFLYFPFWF